MSLGLEQNYAQKLLQLAEDKSKCKIWTRSKYDEIVDLMTKRHVKKTKLLHIITCLKSKFILNILLLFTL